MNAAHMTSPDLEDRAHSHGLSAAVFVGGAGRSGTTFVGHRLGRYAGCIASPESPFLQRLLARWEASRSLPSHVQVRQRLDALRWDERAAWEIDAGVVRELGHLDDISDASLRARAIASGLVSHLARRSISPNGACVDVWVDHTPGNIGRATFLADLFPNGKFVWLIRDPRAVYWSLQHVRWGPKDPESVGWYWLGALGQILQSAEILTPARVRIVTYESLVKNEDCLSDLENWALGGAKAPMLGGQTKVPTHSHRDHGRLGIEPVPTRADRWRGESNGNDIAIVEAAVGDALVLAGYHPVHTARGIPRFRRLRGRARGFILENLINPALWQAEAFQAYQRSGELRRLLRATRPHHY